MTAFIQDNLGPIVGRPRRLARRRPRRGRGLAWRRATEHRSAGSRRSPGATTAGASRASSRPTSAGSTRSPSRSTGWPAGPGRSRSSGRKAFQRIGLVRFNPFEDTGSNQSFALALLDADDDGVVISSLHARGGTRIYAKAVAAGRPEATLSEEEAQALDLARDATGGPGRARPAGPAAGVGGR